MKRFRYIAGGLLVVAGCVPALAMEHVTLKNGFEYDCVRREVVGDKVRLYFGEGGTNYLDIAANAVMRVETVADPVVTATADSSALLRNDSRGARIVAAAEPTVVELGQMLAVAGAAHHIDADLLLSLVHAESGGHARVVSRAGARGLMQLMPGTAAALGVKDAFVPEQNVEGGAKYLDALLTRYKDNIALALAAYNAGPGAVDKYHGGASLPGDAGLCFADYSGVQPAQDLAAGGALVGAARRALPWVVLVAVVAFVGWKLHSSHFDWAFALAAVKAANPWLLLCAIAVIYSNNVLRALRWALFLVADDGVPVRWTRLVGSQFIGFTGLAIFGRIGELIRPLLVARRAGRTFASQVAVVTVERVFDLAAFGSIFAGTLLASPRLRGLPYIGQAGKVIGGLTVVLIVFVVVVLVAGDGVAKVLGRVSPGVAEKVVTFRDGLRVIRGSFVSAAAISLGLWGSVILGYWLVLKAFPGSVNDLGVGAIVVIAGFSIAGSALPVPGGSGAWAGIAIALSKVFGVPDAVAGSAGLLVWLIGTWTVVPVGLWFARVEGVSLGQVLGKAEAAESVATV